MEKYQKYLIGLIGTLILVLFIIFFTHIIAWILIAAVVAMIGGPIVILIKRFKYKNIIIPDWIAALFSLAFLWFVIIVFFRLSVPLISGQLSEFQNINVEALTQGLEGPINYMDNVVQNTPIINQPDFSTEEFVIEKVTSVVSFSSVGDLVSDISNFIWNAIISAFAITFITFFFLKDRNLFDKGVLTITPTKFEEKTKHVLITTRNLISRYLIGIILQSLCMMILYTIGLSIIGLNFNLAVLIGITAGLLNVIPYIGPWIGAIVGFILITVANIQFDFYDTTIPLVLKMIVVVAIAQIIDNIVFQPVIFSNSVRAHPIEIFLIILIAGSLYGVIGMMLAIPGYTVFRVIAREFFNQYKFIRSITQSITDAEEKKQNKSNNASI